MKLHKNIVGAGAIALCSGSIAVAAPLVPIPEIQGDGAVSLMVGRVVRTEGVVTASANSAIYIQAVEGDGDPKTSDGLFVRSPNGRAAVGDVIVVEGRVVENPGGRNGLTQTAIDPAVVVKKGTAPVPAPVELGAAGVPVPTENIAGTGGMIELLESLEGMLVALSDAQVVGPTNEQYFELWVVGDAGAGATGMNSFGGITSTEGDLNPERIQIQLNKNTAPQYQASVGDTIDRIVGTVNYGFGNYEIVATELAPLVPGKPQQHPSVNTNDADITIGSYNVENLDPKVEDTALLYEKDDKDDDVGDGRFKAIAGQVVDLLGSPDIVALQEVQDDDGGEASEVVSSKATLGALIAEIEAIAPSTSYEPLVMDPVDDAEGGQLGGNIRVAFLYDSNRVQPNAGSIERIDGDGFDATRLPLSVVFDFGGRAIRVVNVHLSSKGGSDPLYGSVQPPQDASIEARGRQVDTIVAHLSAATDLPTVVLGDFNSFYYEAPMQALKGAGFENLTERSAPLDRASYVYEGNSQALDHALVNEDLAKSAELVTFHVNSVLPETQGQSDHDPKLLILRGLGNLPNQ